VQLTFCSPEPPLLTWRVGVPPALEMRFRTIVGTLFLYDGDLISSGLDMEPTRLLYSFLSDHLFGEPARPPDAAPKGRGGFNSGVFSEFGMSPRTEPQAEDPVSFPESFIALHKPFLIGRLCDRRTGRRGGRKRLA